MKLHRLSVSNYRGITHREITFPDSGVVVISGPNEIGKTSMIEALDLLIESKDRSVKKDVKQVKPTFADVGSQVEAEITCGPYHFIYRKRFHKRPETHLTIISPRREQLSGDEAHERVLDILDQAIDTNLWKAQRVLQSAGAGVVDLSASDALTRALDLAAGQMVALSGTEPDLLERIDAEYGRYFTPTGRPTGDWARAKARMADAEARCAEALAAISDVDRQVAEHERLSRELARIDAESKEAARELIPLEQSDREVSELRRQCESAAAVAESARAAAMAAHSESDARSRMVDEVQSRQDALDEVTQRLETAEVAHVAAVQAHEEVQLRAGQLSAEVQTARTELEVARRTVDRALARDRIDALSARLARIDRTNLELTAVRDELTSAGITSELLNALEEAVRRVTLAEAALDTAAAHIEVRALADVDVTSAAGVLRVEAGGRWSASATDIIEITAPGVAITRIIPGADAAQQRQDLTTARAELDAALASAGVGDIDEARKRCARRSELLAERDRLQALLEGVLGDDDAAVLRADLSLLREATGEAGDLLDVVDVESARIERAGLETKVRDASDRESTHRAQVAGTGQKLNENATAVTVLREQKAAGEREIASAAQRLAEARALTADAELTRRYTEAVQKSDLAARQQGELTSRLAQLEPERIANQLLQMRQRAQSLQEQRNELDLQLRDIAVRLEMYGSQGLQDRLDAAESEKEYATTEFERIGQKSRAVDLLRTVMLQHRDGMRQRYVDPYRTELERLGRMVFGPTFEVDVDSNLSIRSRTVDGCTVPYESLSGGAKEQLGIVARLATAALVAPQDAVPVIIDDALGFTDETRLQHMGEVFGAIGSEAQVIVLTCSPDRYEAVTGAARISLTA